MGFSKTEMQGFPVLFKQGSDWFLRLDGQSTPSLLQFPPTPDMELPVQVREFEADSNAAESFQEYKLFRGQAYLASHSESTGYDKSCERCGREHDRLARFNSTGVQQESVIPLALPGTDCEG
jgi:hypothetical protein